MDRLLIVMVAVMLPLGVSLGISLALRDVTQAQAVETLTAAVVNIVPEGLILLVSLTMAVSAAKLARRGVLAQQLNAIESLASVSVLCTDKTGTLTEASLRVVELIPADGVRRAELARALGRFAASAPSRNATLEAVHAAQLGGDGALEPTAQVPFSSRRRWSALELDGDRLVLGAPEALLAHASEDALRHAASERAAAGRRVLALAAAGARLPPAAPDAPLPDPLLALGVVVLAERLRENATDTVAFFGAERVSIKVLSGDNPATVEAITRDAGIPADTGALDGGALPEGDEALLAAVRAAPGDRAHLASRQGARGPRAGRFRRVRRHARRRRQRRPGAQAGPARDRPGKRHADGPRGVGPRTRLRRVRRGPEHGPRRTADPAQYPARRATVRHQGAVHRVPADDDRDPHRRLPPAAAPVHPHLELDYRHPRLPARARALERTWRPEGFLRAVARFSLPAGLAAGIGILSAYLLARYAFDLSLTEARTVTAATVVTSGLAIVIVLEDEPGKRRLAVAALCALMALGFVLVCAIPAGREFFELATPTSEIVAAWAIGAPRSVSRCSRSRCAP